MHGASGSGGEVPPVVDAGGVFHPERLEAVNGFGLTIVETLAAIHLIDATFTRLPDVAASGPEWDRIVTQRQVIGRAVHDAQLVASMIVHGITHVLTLNVPDFARYGE